MIKIFSPIILAGCLFFAFPGISRTLPAGKDEVNSINVLFVENTQVDKQGELSGEVLFKLQNTLDSLKERASSKFLLYISNGTTPMVETNDISKAFEKVSTLYNEPSEPAPSTKADIDKLRDLLFRQKFTVKDNIYLHYFLTDHYLNSLLNSGIQSLTTFFARELAYNTSFTGKHVDVFIYYSNQSKTLYAKELEKQFMFSEAFGIAPPVKFHFVVVNK
jgi:hypothetical protein